MIIEEADFKIVQDGNSYILYLLKSKKELQTDSADKFKIGGYYTTFDGALKDAAKFRKSKKYPGKESSTVLTTALKEYKESKEIFKALINKVYQPIFDLKDKLKL
jgi:hypothetical protein